MMDQQKSLNLFARAYEMVRLNIQVLLSKILPVALCSRIIVFYVVLFSNSVFGLREPYFKGETLWNIDAPFFGLFARWDSGFYMEIAKQGYSKEQFWAFFPFYPLLLRYVSYPFSTFLHIDQAMAVAGFLLSNVFFVLLAIYFYKLTRHLNGDNNIAHLSTLFLCIFPSSVFFSALYTESLFLLLITASLYYSELKKWALSTGLAILAGFTRPIGFLVFLPLAYNAIHEPDGNRKSHIVLSLLPLLTYPAFMIYDHLETGNLFIHQQVEAKNWGAGIKNPMVSFINLGVYSGVGYQMLVAPFIFLSVLSIAHFLGNGENLKMLATLGFTGNGEKDKAPYYLFATSLLFIYILFVDYRSFPRFTLTLLPVFWFMGELSTNHETAKSMLIGVCSALLAVVTALFVNWYDFR